LNWRCFVCVPCEWLFVRKRSSLGRRSSDGWDVDGYDVDGAGVSGCGCGCGAVGAEMCDVAAESCGVGVVVVVDFGLLVDG
jgi:hypothetical protein